MSYTTMIHVFPGEKIECDVEFKNSWGSGPLIWDTLVKKYIDATNGNYLFRNETTDKLWKLWNNASVPFHHRAVLMMTFDGAYVSKANYRRAARNIHDFLSDFPEVSEGVSHWSVIEKIFESDPNVPGIGFWLTSITDNPFRGKWNENNEAYGPPIWNKIYEIYAELDSAMATI